MDKSDDEDCLGDAQSYGEVPAAEDGDEVETDSALELEAPDQWDGEGCEGYVGEDVAGCVEEAEVAVEFSVVASVGDGSVPLG